MCELIPQQELTWGTHQLSSELFTKERLEVDIIKKIEKLAENQKALDQQQETPAVATYVQSRQFIRLEKERLYCIKQLNKLKNEQYELLH